jgi:hypothetical protein
LRIRVVLPEPAKPVMIVMGTRDGIFGGFEFYVFLTVEHQIVDFVDFLESPKLHRYGVTPFSA